MEQIYKNIAEIIVLQQGIFNCSPEEVWAKHLHPRVVEVHSYEKVEPYVKQLLNDKNKSQSASSNHSSIQGFFVEYEGYVVALIQTPKGKKLKVYQNGACVYQYPEYNPSDYKIQLMLRRYLKIRRFPIHSWKHIIPSEFKQLITATKSLQNTK